MRSLVPGGGFALQFSLAPGDVQGFFLGPIPVDHWIEIVELGVAMDGQAGGSAVNVGLGVGAVGDTAAATFTASTSLIQRSDGTVSTRPVVVFRSIQSAFASFRLYPGYYVEGGPVFVVGRAVADVAVAAYEVNVAVKTLRLDRGR